ncbi:MAG TPA: tail fiber domain-containing protein [Thermoanaerobaculia bacterium]|nr:tail fiber domain-containing protein [Thermoanaerobaculia bacterium]
MFSRPRLITAFALIAAIARIASGLGTAEAVADVPDSINYRGILRSAGGSPVTDGSYTVTFKIYDVASGPSPAVWTESKRVTTAGGLFSTFLGSVTALPSSVFSGPSHYLGISVNLEPEVAPRTLINIADGTQGTNKLVTGGVNGSVQFNSHGKLGGDADNFFWSKTDKRLGIGTKTPHEQLEITGNLRLPISTASVGVIKSGENPFIHNFGTNSTFIGVDAGNFSMTGINITAIGENALHNNTIGEGNTGTGVNALSSNTEGTCNTATGGQTLQANTEGSNNTATGHFALFSNITGSDNTASGVLALYYTTGSRNTASGDNALVNNGNGSDNTANGVFALATNTTGTFNTGIGAQADVSTGALTNATAIGSKAVVNASNKIRLGDDAVTVIEGRVAYTFTSDKNEKENFRPVNGDEVVRKIRGLNLGTWNYIGNDPQQFRHYGPVAQEFFAAFGHDEVGTSGTPTTINSGDEMGILMIAVQALEKRTEEVEAMKLQIAELREMIRALATQPK